MNNNNYLVFKFGDMEIPTAIEKIKHITGSNNTIGIVDEAKAQELFYETGIRPIRVEARYIYHWGVRNNISWSDI